MRRRSKAAVVPTLVVAVLAVGSLLGVDAQVLHSARLRSCLPNDGSAAAADRQLHFSDLWAQFDQGQSRRGELASGVNLSTLPAPIRNQDGAILGGTGDILRVVMTGTVASESAGYSNQTGLLATLLLNSEVLSFDVANNRSSLCSAIRTNEGTTGVTSNGSSTVSSSGCPYQGDIALGFTVPLSSSYPLTTINTNLVALDSSNPAQQLACYDLAFTPFYPDYFPYEVVRFLIIGIVASYAVLYYVARFYASYTTWLHDNETQLASSLTLMLAARPSGSSRRGMWRTIYFYAWAGKQVVASASLRRFVTAELREIFTLLAWFSLIGTVAVEWPGFAYPIFRQAAWMSLVYNNSLSFTQQAPHVLPENATLPDFYNGQFAEPSSPLYLDGSLPNVLLDLESEANGIERWSRMVGVRHQDVWAVCAFTFYAICAAAVALQLVLFLLNMLSDTVAPIRRDAPVKPAPEDKVVDFEHDEAMEPSLRKEPSPPDSLVGDRRSAGTAGRYLDSGDFADDRYLDEDDAGVVDTPAVTTPLWRLHLMHLHGNLVRILLFFHLPLTLFSMYQCTLFSTAPVSRFALAVLTLAVVCVAAPVHLVWQLHVQPIRKLYLDLPTLLAYGPLYNIYSDECVLFPLVTFASNLINGVVIGAAQSTGTAQAAVVLICEVAHTLVTSLWLPWGGHSAMGPLAFLLSLARIVTAVLLVVLSPTVDVSASAGSWLAYVVLFCAGLVLLLFLLMAGCKLVELTVRVIAGVPFDESRSPKSGGLSGALRKLDRRGGGGKHRRHGDSTRQSEASRRRAIEERRRRHIHRERLARASEVASVNTHTFMLPSAARPAGHPGPASSAMSMTPNASPFPSSGLVDDDGFIMSAMSARGWDSPPAHHGGYSGVTGPTLRPGPQQWSSELSMATAAPPASAQLVGGPHHPGGRSRPGAGPSSGFARVGGGKATQNNPYQLAHAEDTAYPPYPPISSADMYAGRRGSQGTFGGAEAMPPAHRQASRPSLTLPSSSALLSNVVSPGGRLDAEHNRRLSTRARARQARKGGFFGRFKSQPVYSDSDDSEDSSAEDPAGGGRRKRGGLLGVLGGGGGRARSGSAGRRQPPEAEELYELTEPLEPPFEPAGDDSAEKGFSVVRKPRPRPAAPSRTPSSSPAMPAEASQPEQAPPHVSVQAPSRPTSLQGELVDSP